MAKESRKKVSGLDLKLARIRAGIKQIDLSMMTGIAPKKLSFIENGRQEPTDEDVEKIMSVINEKAA